jgi:hypothetical protein
VGGGAIGPALFLANTLASAMSQCGAEDTPAGGAALAARDLGHNEMGDRRSHFQAAASFRRQTLWRKEALLAPSATAMKPSLFASVDSGLTRDTCTSRRRRHHCTIGEADQRENQAARAGNKNVQ